MSLAAHSRRALSAFGGGNGPPSLAAPLICRRSSWALTTAPAPVILLFGWLAARDRDLEKYSQLYRDMGAQVITHQPTVLQTALPAAADRALLRAMKHITYTYSSICTVRGEAPPVLVHTMSNAGFIAYGTMLHLTSLLSAARPPTLTPAPGASSAPPPRLQFDPSSWAPDRGGGGGMTARSAALWGGGEGAHGGAMAGSWGWGWRRRGSSSGDVSGSGGEHPLLSYPPSMAVLSAFRQVLRNTQGIVIDSAPSQATPLIWGLGLVSALLSQPAQEVELAHPVLLRAARRAVERYFQHPAIIQRIREVKAAWHLHAPPCPQMYLYSQADALIPFQHVEHFMEQQAARGVPLHHHCWADSAHCEHLRKHPEQYRSLVRSFAEHALHAHTPPETWI